MGKTCPNKCPDTLLPGDKVKVAFIGEAPGREEEAVGEPFMGAAGEEFDKWIRFYFIRSQCFIGNLSQERPPDNKLSLWYQDKACLIPNPRLANWISALKEQLEELRPNIIVALGRHPTYILTGKDGITKQWGSLLPCTLVPGLKVIALLHPSFVMRGMWDLRPIIDVWMKRTKKHSEFPEYIIPQRELVVDPSLEEVMFHLDRLMAAPELAFDIETIPETPIPYERWITPDRRLIYTPHIMSCISFSDSQDWSISIPFSRGGGQHRWAFDIEKEIYKKISRLLNQEGTLKIAHNLMFDFLQLAGRKISVAPPYYDTLVAHNRAYIDLTKKKLKRLQLNRLAFCTALYTEEPYYKEDHKDENKLDRWRGDDRAFWIYNAKDSAVLHEIKAATWSDLSERGMSEMFIRTMKEFKPLACMGLQGILRDEELLRRKFVYQDKEWQGITGFVENKIQLLQDELDKSAGYHLNTKSNPQMKKFLYSEQGFPIQYNKTTGKVTTDEGAIAKIYQKTKHPVLTTIKHLTRFRTFKENYVDIELSPDGRSRTTYNQAKTSTARISSSDAIIGKGKNLQVIPSYPKVGEDDYNYLIKIYKKTFLPDPGFIMWKRDYKQAEAMVVAWLSEDLQQISDFLAGIDMHCRTLEILYDIPYEVAMEKVAEGNPEWKMKRNLGKRVRHGANYKLGELELHRQFALLDIDIPTKECRHMLQAIASNVPSIIRWHAEVEDTLRRTRKLTNPLGLERTFFGMVDNAMIREAIAFVPQSTVGMLMNFALQRIYHESDILTLSDFLLQIHDAIVMQSPEEVMEKHSTEVGELMLVSMIIKGRELVIPSDLEVGLNWGELK